MRLPLVRSEYVYEPTIKTKREIITADPKNSLQIISLEKSLQSLSRLRISDYYCCCILTVASMPTDVAVLACYDSLTRRNELAVLPSLECKHSLSMRVACKTQSKQKLELRNTALVISIESNIMKVYHGRVLPSMARN